MGRVAILFLILVVIVFGVFFTRPKSILAPLPTPEFSGWVAWWEERAAYDVIQKFPGSIQSVSPVWFMVHNDGTLSEIGKIDRKIIIKELKQSNVRILPTLGSEVGAELLSVFLNNKDKTDTFIVALVDAIKTLEVDGVDIDLEGIKKEDKDTFSLFLSELAQKLHDVGLQLSVTVHAQTEKVAWIGVEGQDLTRIADIADEVRIMIYDEHSAGSEPGSIASFNWIKNVARYNLSKMPKEKIVIGIPSYGYIWTKDDAKGLQFDEFNTYIKEENYTSVRDTLSGELVIKSQDFVGWLSDSEAMIAKINIFRSLGLNRFVIWHLGGMDEKFFYVDWLQQPILQ